jgi:hypothetical protein
MEMQQMIGCLLAGQEQMMAKIETDREEMMARIDANQAKADATLKVLKEDIKNN